MLTTQEDMISVTIQPITESKSQAEGLSASDTQNISFIERIISDERQNRDQEGANEGNCSDDDTFVLARKLLRRRHVRKDRLRQQRETEEQKQVPTTISDFTAFENYFSSCIQPHPFQSPKKTTKNINQAPLRRSSVASAMVRRGVKRTKIANDFNSSKIKCPSISPARKNQKLSGTTRLLSSLF